MLHHLMHSCSYSPSNNPICTLLFLIFRTQTSVKPKVNLQYYSMLLKIFLRNTPVTLYNKISLNEVKHNELARGRGCLAWSDGLSGPWPSWHPSRIRPSPFVGQLEEFLLGKERAFVLATLGSRRRLPFSRGGPFSEGESDSKGPFT